MPSAPVPEGAPGERGVLVGGIQRYLLAEPGGPREVAGLSRQLDLRDDQALVLALEDVQLPLQLRAALDGQPVARLADDRPGRKRKQRFGFFRRDLVLELIAAE